RLLGPSLARWADTLVAYGEWVADAVDRAAAYTDRYAPPTLKAYESDGRLANRIVKNPAWQAVSREAYRRGAVGLNYADDPAPFLPTFAMGYPLPHAHVPMHSPLTTTAPAAYVLHRLAP